MCVSVCQCVSASVAEVSTSTVVDGRSAFPTVSPHARLRLI